MNLHRQLEERPGCVTCYSVTQCTGATDTEISRQRRRTLDSTILSLSPPPPHPHHPLLPGIEPVTFRSRVQGDRGRWRQCQTIYAGTIHAVLYDSPPLSIKSTLYDSPPVSIKSTLKTYIFPSEYRTDPHTHNFFL